MGRLTGTATSPERRVRGGSRARLDPCGHEFSEAVRVEKEDSEVPCFTATGRADLLVHSYLLCAYLPPSLRPFPSPHYSL